MADEIGVPFPADEPLELGLKSMNAEQLGSLLLDSQPWQVEERERIAQAIEFAAHLHRDQIYKNEPYILHPLRVANRIAGYLDLQDADLVISGLLHDGVEDHAAEILHWHNRPVPDDLQQAQTEALNCLRQWFGDRAADAITQVTNPPDLMETAETDTEKIAAYVRKVVQGASTFDGWITKFCDWCEHAPGIYFSEAEPDRQVWFARKYLAASFVLAARFGEHDIQSRLSPAARLWVTNQIALGRRRLIALLPTP